MAATCLFNPNLLPILCMIRFPAFLLAGLALCVSLEAAKSSDKGLSVESRVDAVTVYPDSARVTRVGTARLSAGVNVLRLVGLPEDLATESIQVAGKGSGPSRILDVRSETEFHRESSSERLKALDAKLQELKDAKTVNIDKMTVVRSSLDYLESIQKFVTSHPAEGESAEPIEPEKWLSLIAFQEKESLRLMEELRGLSLANRDLDEEIAVLNSERRTLSNPAEFRTKTVLVSVDADAEMDFDLELRYQIRGASWSPEYDVFVDLESSELELVMKAAVQHSSVADWEDVQLTLSTAKPSLTGYVPEMHPWRVLKAPESDEEVFELSPFGTSGKRISALAGNRLNEPASSGYQATSGNFQVAAPARVVAGSYGESEQTSSVASTEFVLPYRTDLAAGEDPQRVRVASFKVKADIYHLSMARISAVTYLKARAKNTADFPLLAGPTQVFLNGDFIARSRIDFLAAGAEMNFLLGGSSRVTVKRELVNKLNETVGFGGKQNRQTQEYLFTLTNNDREEQLLVLRDQIPVSGNEEIVVNLIEPDRTKVEIDDTGMMIWRLTLAPGEERKVKLAFSVQYPKDWSISGL